MADLPYDQAAAAQRILAALSAHIQPSDKDLVEVAASEETFAVLLQGVVHQMLNAVPDYPLYPEQAARAGTDILEHLAATDFNHAIATGSARQLLAAAAYLQDALDGVRLALAARLG
jgi:histidinol-phosphate/aromatic aminotransferase/cobyric acid decarboxylase-like protein